MGNNIVRIEIHKSLQEVLEEVRREVAIDMKKHFGIKEIMVPRTLSSQVLAAKMKGKKSMHYKIIKTGKDTATLQLL